ncbi:chalcone isomerase family protein [Undibacterium arcticum]
MEETARVANQELKLNGAGMRYKAIFKVYVGGLYLTERKTSAADALAAPGPKRITLVTMREISSDDLGRSFMEGLNKNSDRTEKTKIISQMQRLGEVFGSTPELKKGDVVTIDWLPGTGTLIAVNGKKITDAFPDLVFYNALLKIWLGDKPADGQLKRAMLGEKPEDFKRQ